MRKEMKTDRVRNREVQQFWKLCKGLRRQDESIAPRDIMPLDTGNTRAARAPTLEDIDRRGVSHRRTLRQMLPLTEARHY